MNCNSGRHSLDSALRSLGAPARVLRRCSCQEWATAVLLQRNALASRRGDSGGDMLLLPVLYCCDAGPTAC